MENIFISRLNQYNALYEIVSDREKWLQDSMEAFIDAMKDTGQWDDMTKSERKKAAEAALHDADKSHNLFKFLCNSHFESILSAAANAHN